MDTNETKKTKTKKKKKKKKTKPKKKKIAVMDNKYGKKEVGKRYNINKHSIREI